MHCEATSPKLIAISQDLMSADDPATSQSSMSSRRTSSTYCCQAARYATVVSALLLGPSSSCYNMCFFVAEPWEGLSAPYVLLVAERELQRWGLVDRRFAARTETSMPRKKDGKVSMTYSLRRLEKAYKGALSLPLCHFCCKTRLRLMLSM